MAAFATIHATTTMIPLLCCLPLILHVFLSNNLEVEKSAELFVLKVAIGT